MRVSLIMIAFLVSAYQMAHSAQQVGGLEINYAHPFKEDVATSNTWMSNLPDNVSPFVVSIKVFVAKPSNGIGEVRLMKVHYVPEVNGSVDGAANESAQRISTLKGITNFNKYISPLSISGLPARQVSISADRWGGKLGGEFMVVYDKSTNNMWQMQLIFSNKKGLNSLASLSLEDKRNYAKNLLSTIKVVK